ncbi:MAG: ABC transporter permease subunit/CPBP intramembrane protease [Phycisphaerae bacterium]
MRLRSVSIIFRKELIEILRDRRTLIAMVVVPILLYPVLMLGSIHAAQFQSGKMQREEIRIAVPDDATAQRLSAEIEADNAAVPAGSPEAADCIRRYDMLVTPDPRDALRKGAVQVAIVHGHGPGTWDRWEIDPPFVLCYDSAEIRSEMARTRLERVLERRRVAVREERLARLPEEQRELFAPRAIPVENVASPEKVGGSLLGNVLPLILALMTITAAVYPAIDLTAGERERGTLETLMVAPVPVIDLIVGKFLVVAAVSLIAAALNLASIGLTLRFGDVQEMLAQGMQARIPVAVLPLILLAMIPFAILFSAILIAVASFARSFKEAQNYVMPVIMAALIPGTAGALPGVELHGVMALVPVANMVLLTRELLLGHFANWPAMLVALGSTCFYAVVAVVVAARLFGQEAVLFADAGSWKTLFRRRFFVPSARPSPTHVLLYIAVLFPVWFHIQGQLGPHIGLSSVLIVVFFGVLPLALARYLKIDWRRTFSLRGAAAIQWVGAVAIGLSSWVIASEVLVLQSRVIPLPEGLAGADAEMTRILAGWPLPLLLLALAVVPGICEELTFRGFVLSGLQSRLRPATAILVSALFFGAFHFLLLRFGVTVALGILLGYVCRRSGSIGPAMLIHIMHNSWLFVLSRWDRLAAALGAADLDGTTHLPRRLVAASAVLIILGLVAIARPPQDADPLPPPADR